MHLVVHPIILSILWTPPLQHTPPHVARHAKPAETTAAIELGKLLFFDPVLSGNYKRSCASCHRPQKAFTDQRITARAYAFSENLAVNTPTLLGVARQRRFLNDGRANSLSAAIGAVLNNPAELNGSYDQASQRLQSSPDYTSRFRLAFGRGPSETTINRALIAYLKSLSPAPTRVSLPDSLRAGARLFAQVRCATCHTGPDYRDGRRHQTRAGRWVKTPTLRNLMTTPPYLADGSAPTVEAVLTQPFHARQGVLSLAQRQRLLRFLAAIPPDTTTLSAPTLTQLPVIPGAPPRRIGGIY